MTNDERRKQILEEARARVDGTWREPEPSSPVPRTDQVDGLTYKVTENALVEAAEPLQQPAAADPWNEWLEARLDQERSIIIGAVIEIVGEVVARLRSELRNTDRDVEINQEFVKIWRSVEQATKSIVEIRRERVEQFRDVGGDPAKKVKMN